jgi:hypothetical protein
VCAIERSQLGRLSRVWESGYIWVDGKIECRIAWQIWISKAWLFLSSRTGRGTEGKRLRDILWQCLGYM